MENGAATHKYSSRLNQCAFLFGKATRDARDDASAGSLEQEEGILRRPGRGEKVSGAWAERKEGLRRRSVLYDPAEGGLRELSHERRLVRSKRATGPKGMRC